MFPRRKTLRAKEGNPEPKFKKSDGIRDKRQNKTVIKKNDRQGRLVLPRN